MLTCWDPHPVRLPSWDIRTSMDLEQKFRKMTKNVLNVVNTVNVHPDCRTWLTP